MANVADFSSMRIDPNQYLGLSYNKYKSQIYKKALVSPEEYYELREQVEEKLQKGAIDSLYNTFYHALTTGTEKDGTSGLGLPTSPNVQLQRVNEICLSACETLNKIITEEVLELLLPLDYNKILQSRLHDKGQARLMGDQP